MARAFKSLCPKGKFRTASPLSFLSDFTFLPLQSQPQPIRSRLHGPIAQLDRVLDYESRGRGFESSSVRHLLPLEKLQYIKPPTMGDLRCVAQRIYYVNRKGGDSVQERTQ